MWSMYARTFVGEHEISIHSFSKLYTLISGKFGHFVLIKLISRRILHPNILTFQKYSNRYLYDWSKRFIESSSKQNGGYDNK